MKLLNLFHTKSNRCKEAAIESDVATVRESVSSHSHSTRTSSHKKDKSKRKKKTTPVDVVIEEYHTPNEKIISAFLQALNDHADEERLLRFFASDQVMARFEDTPGFPVSVFVAELQKFFKSFPDIKFSWDFIKEEKSGQVLVEELLVKGTHSGEPYAFANFPPVPAKGKHCAMDPERFWYTLKDGKITSVDIIALGSKSGLPGFYMEVGGKMDMPQGNE
ncbi:unknown protein [Seminavis robusta]|uniref:SnoaL-like domain-containing protein n=1 Tax=Seminavis robusta TaxID=568900 RepID=A0A9N8H2A3_9STRA|nr:unknown protein [Seminavis robusta]|eukprot:Sro32_g020860.1 n/a (220) ;mRNA; r:91336-91995